jgi:hypothetical protein
MEANIEGGMGGGITWRWRAVRSFLATTKGLTGMRLATPAGKSEAGFAGDLAQI